MHTIHRKSGSLAALTGIFMVFGCGQADERRISREHWPIINGTVDTSQAHQAVVYIQTIQGGFVGACTGTLIAHRVVLTAAHCADDADIVDIWVGFGNDDDNLDWRAVSEKWVHPAWDPDALVNDIAMLRISQAPPAGVTPIPALPGSLGITSSDIGDDLEYVGFGQTWAGGGAGTKMKMTGDLEWICLTYPGCGWPNPGLYNTLCQDQDPSGICSGDSGGPAFIWRGGQEYVAGISSYVGEGCVSFGCSVKVDEYESDILDFIGGVNGSSCVDPVECTSGHCEDGVCCATSCPGECMVCNAPGHLGSCVAAPNGHPCPDTNPCDGEETCQGGTCGGGTSLDCDDDEPCTTDSCNPSSGCVHSARPDGADCSDGNPCDGVEACQGGVCRSPGTPPCDDQNPCTSDTCHPTNGCQHAAVANGTACFDNDVCNGAEVCQGGTCQIGTPIDCEDGNPCTNDNCDRVTGCSHQDYPDNMLCDDLNACTGDGRCQGGVCQQGAAIDCDDLNICTRDSCAPGAGCQHDPLNDGTACGGGLCGEAQCQAGNCVGSGSRDCDDQNPCTHDGCDPDTGCIHSGVPDGTSCDDGDLCTMNDSCQAGVCAAGSAASCDDQNLCTSDSCTVSGCQHTPVADGSGCGGGMCGAATCQGGECISSEPATCDDQVPCTRDWCDPATGCKHQQLPQGYECGECMACVDEQCVVLADCLDDGGSGCGCTAAGANPAGLAGLLLLLGLGVLRGRRHG